MQTGQGQFTYEALVGWEQLPDGWSLGQCPGVAVDSRDRVYVFNRSEHPMIVFGPDGEFLSSWGEGMFVRPHGLIIGPDDSLYCSDDFDHTVKKCSPEGELLMKLGTSGALSDTGAEGLDYRTIQRAAPPFNYPTSAALASDGSIYVSDGYGNARVHKFSPEGDLLLSWGEPGSGPGQFNVPHGIAIDGQDRVYVADRENSRVQIFTSNGELLTEWKDVARPCQVYIDDRENVFTAELGYKAGLFPGDTAPSSDPPGGRVRVFNPEGELQARWGNGDHPDAPGDFYGPHGICSDSSGDLYVGEVTPGSSPEKCHVLQKFVRKR